MNGLSQYDFKILSVANHYLDKNYDQSIQLAEEIIGNVEETKDPERSKIVLFTTQGLSYGGLGDKKSANYYLSKSYKTAVLSDRNDLIELSLHKQGIYYSVFDPNIDSTIYYQLKALKLIENTKDVNINYANLGLLYTNINSDSLAIYYLQKAIELSDTSTHASLISKCYSRLSIISYSNKNYIEALNYIEEAIKMAKIGHNYYLVNLAAIKKIKMESFIDPENIDVENCNSLFNYFVAKKDTTSLIYVSVSLATIYSRINDKKRTQYYFDFVKKIAFLEKIKGRNRRILIKEIIEISDYLREYEYGAKILQSYYSEVERNFENELEVSSQEFKNEYKKQINEKSKEIEIANLIKQNKSLLNIYLMVFIVTSLFLFALYFNKREKNQKEFNNIIQKRSDDLLAFNTELDLKNKELERFAFISSHDLKTPLITMIGFTDLLKEETKGLKNEKFKEYANYIQSSSKQMYELVENVLEYSILTKKNRTANKEHVNVKDLINDIDKDLTKLWIKEFSISYDNDDLTIYANPSNLYSLFRNIIENGLKYNESPFPTIDIFANKLEDYTHIKFIDNGIGIDETHQKYIFEKFNRLHNHTKYTGTGLGLAIVKKLIDNKGGKISLKSKLGEGSEFTISIPNEPILNPNS